MTSKTLFIIAALIAACALLLTSQAVASTQPQHVCWTVTYRTTGLTKHNKFLASYVIKVDNKVVKHGNWSGVGPAKRVFHICRSWAVQQSRSIYASGEIASLSVNAGLAVEVKLG